MKEIGGYIEFGGLINKEYHNAALKFNSFRSALSYFIKQNKIKKIYLPIYLCDEVYNALLKEKCQIELYHINKDFEPIINNFDNESYVYIVNYYGLISNQKLKQMQKKYKNIIVDNTHSFFRKPLKNICTIYNCRKYFGVPDGAYMYSNIKNNDDLAEYKVFDKIDHLIGRLEKNAQEYYEDFSLNDEKFKNSEICKISKLSSILLGAIDYKKAYKTRITNYNYLYDRLAQLQKLKVPKNLTFMYPLYVENGQEKRKKLINQKIYIPKLWSNIIAKDQLNDIERQYIENILPIPIDQRYTIEDMDVIIQNLEVL